MSSFKQDVILYKNYPGITHTEILKMPYFEYRAKIEYIKELAEQEQERSKSTNESYREQMNNMTSNMKMPEMPKMPSMDSLPKISLPKF